MMSKTNPQLLDLSIGWFERVIGNVLTVSNGISVRSTMVVEVMVYVETYLRRRKVSSSFGSSYSFFFSHLERNK